MTISISPPPETLTPAKIESLSHQKISTCFQCQKCTNGCPMNFAMDISPHRVIHMIRLGMINEVINSDTIWVCASCETCTARCPNDIDIAHVMDTLRHLSIKKGVKASQKQAPIFHNSFLSSIQMFGRTHEMSMAMDFTLRSSGLGGLFKQAALGLTMISKGKMKIIPERFSAGKEVKAIFRETEGK
jgi:heterodisulfide reductase subunit C